MKKYTLNDIRGMEKDWLTPAEVAPVLGCTGYAINQQAFSNASLLGFPVIIIGKRVKVPRIGFIKFMEGEKL